MLLVTVRVAVWVFLIGVSTSILQPSVFGFSSQLPPIFNQAIMAGQGVAGAGVSFMRLATKGFVPNPKESALLFFSISCFVMIVCVFAYFALLKMEFTQYHLERSQTVRAEHAALVTPRTARRQQKEYVPPGVENGAVLSTPTSSSKTVDSTDAGMALERKFTLRLFLSKRLGMRTKDTPEEALLEQEGTRLGGRSGCTLARCGWVDARLVWLRMTEPEPGSMAHFIYLTGKMWAYAWGVLLIFLITFSVFPGEITSIKYEGTFPALDFLSVRTIHPPPPPPPPPLPDRLMHACYRTCLTFV